MLALERQVIELQGRAEGWDLKVLLQWGLSEFGRSLAIAASLGAEDVVLIDQASRLRSEFRVFTLDTDFLFPDTYALIDRIEKRYGIQDRKTLRNPGGAHALRPDPSPAGGALWRSLMGFAAGSMLPIAKSGAAQEKTFRPESMGYRCSPRSGTHACWNAKAGMGREIWSGEAQSDRGLELEAGLGIHPRQQRAL